MDSLQNTHLNLERLSGEKRSHLMVAGSQSFWYPQHLAEQPFGTGFGKAKLQATGVSPGSCLACAAKNGLVFSRRGRLDRSQKKRKLPLQLKGSPSLGRSE